MSVALAVLTGLVMGIVFGFVLEKSRVFEPAVILGQFQLRNFLMLKVFLSAVVAGLLIVAVMVGAGLTGIYPKATLFSADIVGGLMLGAGIALAGACPGTVLAQIGAGYKDAILTLVGGIAGALTFTYLEPTLRPIMLTGGPGKLTLDVMLGQPFVTVALGLASVLVVCLVILERYSPWREELGPADDGLLAGPSTALITDCGALGERA